MERPGTRWNAVPEGRKPKRRSGTSFSLALVQLTPPLSDRILGHSLHSGTFLKKNTLFKTIGREWIRMS
jgi:hypothetical protein